jgi:PHD/YefM family antitoxin component YafN of YafNO toxin-antitoxin module
VAKAKLAKVANLTEPYFLILRIFRIMLSLSLEGCEEGVIAMIRVSASEFQKAFGAMSDKALREPVAITKQGRDHLIVLSAEEYLRLKRRDRQVYRAADFPDELLELVASAEPPSEAEAFNHVVNDAGR